MLKTLTFTLLCLFFIAGQCVGNVIVSAGSALPQTVDGMVVKGSAPDMFLIQGGSRRRIPDLTTLIVLDVGPVVDISDADLNAIPLGTPFPSLPGSVLKGSAAQVYIIRKGKRRAVSLSQSQILASAAKTVTNATLNSIPLGDNYDAIAAPPTPTTVNCQVQWFDSDSAGVRYSQTFSTNSVSISRHNEDPIFVAGAFAVSDPMARIYRVAYDCYGENSEEGVGSYCQWSSAPTDQYTFINGSFVWRRKWHGREVSEWYTAYYQLPRLICRSQ